MAVKRNPFQGSDPEDYDNNDMPEQAGGDIAILLARMQRQLVFLEKKIDGLIYQLQEKPYRERSSTDSPYPRKHSRYVPEKRHSQGHRKEFQGEPSGEKSQGRPFYSKFRKPDGRSGSVPGKKPFFHKNKK